MPKILFIEDDKDSALLVQQILEHHGYEYFWAKTGFEGLNAVQTHKPDLILLDLNLPDLDGKVIANRLRDMNIPIIALTSQTSPQVERLARAFGCVEYLTKPIMNTEVFVATLAEFLPEE